MIFKETRIKSLSFAVRDSRSPTCAVHLSAFLTLFHTAGVLSAPTGHLSRAGKALCVENTIL